MSNKKPRAAADQSNSSELLDRAWRGDPGAAHELIRHFQKGYPLERLRELFRSELPHAVASAAYIASELGSGATPLIDDFPIALQHAESWGRSAGVDCVFNCASERDGEVVAMAVSLLSDPSIYTRGVALFRLRYADLRLIRAALPFLKAEPLGPLLAWFASDGSHSHTVIVKRLRSLDPLERRVALASAARPTGAAVSGNVRDLQALVLAASSEDAEIAEHAKSILQTIAEIRRKP